MSSRPSAFVLTNPTAYDGKVVIYTLAQLLAFPPPQWLIRDLVPSEALTGLAGPPGVGKSMLALDWALYVATGTPWLDRPVDQGFALYIAAEGHTGLSVRAKAWLAHHHIPRGRAKFGLLKGRLAIQGGEEPGEYDQTQSDYDTLFNRIDHEIGYVPKLVIIDTLARCIEGDENASLDMTNFLDGAEQMIDRYKSSVIVIHHKNAAGTRERGHTSFRGALGALFFLEHAPRRKDILILKNDKQRDAREAEDVALTYEQVEGSAVLVPTELPAARGEKGSGVPVPMRKVDMLTLLGSQENGLTFSEWRLASGVPRRTFARRVAQLLRDGEVYKETPESGIGGRYYVVPSVTDLAELDREED